MSKTSTTTNKKKKTTKTGNKKTKTTSTATTTTTTTTKPSKRQLFDEIFSNNDTIQNDYDPEDAFDEDEDRMNRRNNSKLMMSSESTDKQEKQAASNNNNKGLLLRTQADLDESLTRGTYSGHTVNRQDLFDNDNDFEPLQTEDYLNEMKQAQRALELEKQGFGDDENDDDDDDDTDGSNRLSSHLGQMAVDNKAVMESIQKDRLKQKRSAQCVFNQRLLYNQLLKARILLQKPLSTCNLLPQSDMFGDFLQFDGKEHEQIVNECSQTRGMLFEMLCDLLDMQHELFSLNECRNADRRKENISGSTLLDARAKKKRRLDNDEEEGQDLMDQIWQVVDSSYSIYSDYRAESLEKWNTKTRMQSALNTKQFKSMNADIMTQVQNALKDDRMRQRTHVKRFSERILGKRAREEEEDEEQKHDEDEEKQEIDVELFDDKDFYQVLLRDFIQDVGGSAMLKDGGNLVSALQKNAKTKKKRREPIGLTKDRSIVYKVHEKLVNFMTPVESEIPKSAETLFAHLFGGGTVEIEDEESEPEELKQLNEQT